MCVHTHCPGWLKVIDAPCTQGCQACEVLLPMGAATTVTPAWTVPLGANTTVTPAWTEPWPMKVKALDKSAHGTPTAPYVTLPARPRHEAFGNCRRRSGSLSEIMQIVTSAVRVL